MSGQDYRRFHRPTSSSSDAEETSDTSWPTDSTPTDITAERMTLRELTDAAGVSVRTVRYYIAEGLLPPPAGSGPGSVYTAAHLDRLQVIHRLKGAYLPLKEIRRHLSGLDDDGVRALLSRDRDEAGPESRFDQIFDPSMADAREYLSMMESSQSYHTEPLGLALPPSASAPSQRPRQRPVPSFAAPARPLPVQQAEATLWHRIPLGDEAELVISDEVYARHPDRVDWLVRWARKVFR